MPRSASSSTTSRKDSPNLRYQRTARVMTSGGNRYPAKADLETGQRQGCWTDLIAPVSVTEARTTNATVPAGHVADPPRLPDLLGDRIQPHVRVGRAVERAGAEGRPPSPAPRSEEHTSELQSRE